MTEHLPARGLAPSRRREVAAEIRAVRQEAQSRYSEVDLLVAALREHIQDLRAERDRLLAQIAAMQESGRLESSNWMWRGTKGPR